MRIKEEVRRLQRRHQLKSSSSQPVATTTASSDLSDDETVQVTDSRPHEHQRLNANQQHLLTLKQVNLICARLLKEREEKIREEYDRILSNKLNGNRRNSLFLNLTSSLFQNNTKVLFDSLKTN